MKKLGIIGCGWLGNHLAERLSNQYEIYATTTTASKIAALEAKGYTATLVSFPDEMNSEMKKMGHCIKAGCNYNCSSFFGIAGIKNSYDRET